MHSTMRRATTSLSVVGSAVALMLWAVLAGAQPRGYAHTCRPADNYSSFLQSIIVSIVSGTDSTSGGLRAALQLPQLSASSVSVATQAQTCSKAAQALDVAQDTTIADRTMYVFKLGNSRYGVFSVVGEATTSPGVIYYFTNKWDFLSIGQF